MKVRSLLACLAVGAMFAVRASAHTYDMAQSGRWTAFGGTDEGGHEVCGVSTYWQDGRAFLIKRYEGDQQVVVQAISPSWQIGGENINVELKIGRNGDWTARAAVLQRSNGLEFTIPALKMVDFFQELGTADAMVLIMGENKISWVMDMDGSTDVTDKFSDCIKMMTN